MQREYENEMKKNNKIEEEFRRQQERLQMLEEFQRKDAEMRKKKFSEAKESRKEIVSEVKERSNSPPVPAVRTKELLEKAVSPTAVVTSPLTEVKPGNVYSCLAEIRRSIMQDQQKLKKDFKNSYEVMDRRTVQDLYDDEE
ncbi:hypothetical protein X975_04110, partial [Stegodyphus mimosarum]